MVSCTPYELGFKNGDNVSGYDDYCFLLRADAPYKGIRIATGCAALVSMKIRDCIGALPSFSRIRFLLLEPMSDHALSTANITAKATEVIWSLDEKKERGRKGVCWKKPN